MWYWFRTEGGDAEGEPLVQAGDVAGVEDFALAGWFGSDGMPDVVGEGVLGGWWWVVCWEVGAGVEGAARGGDAGGETVVENTDGIRLKQVGRPRRGTVTAIVFGAPMLLGVCRPIRRTWSRRVW